MDLNVFISWSGPRSRKLAEALYDFIPDVIQQARPWLSSEDIDRGRRWGLELAGALKEARIGILCLTPENIESRWVLFEAGALAKTLDTAYVCPYLLGLEKSQVPPPLGDFQMSVANREETLSLVKALNNALGRPIEDPRRLTRTFDRCWPALEEVIAKLAAQKPENEVPPKPRNAEDLLGEILTRIREVGRSGTAAPASDDAGAAFRLASGVRNISDTTKNIVYQLTQGTQIGDLELPPHLTQEQARLRVQRLMSAFNVKDPISLSEVIDRFYT